MKEKENKKVSILSRWKNQKQGSVEKGITKAPESVAIPLSYGQQQLWFLQQLYPDNPFYNYSEGYTLTGNLQIEKLIKALKRVCARHDILFSSYHTINDEVVQKTNGFDIEVPFFDISDLQEAELQERLDELILSNATKKFDLTKPPLFSIVLIKISEQEHLLLFTLHHIITDKWSMGIFRDQLAKCYTDFCKNKIPEPVKAEIQYQDYAYWQRSQDLDPEQLTYWKNKLANAPAFLDIPTDFSRPSQPSFKGALHTKVYSKELSAAILDLAKELKTTPYTVLLATFKILLLRYSGQHDILVGSPISNRNNQVLENLIGFFNDTVVLRNTITESMRFTEVLNSVRNDVLNSFSNKDIPFDFLVKSLKPERLPNTNPFFQVMFLYHAVPDTPSFGADLKLSHKPMDVGVAKFDLTLYISEDKRILSTTFEYATDLYAEVTINRFQAIYQQLLEEIVKNPDQVVSRIPLPVSQEMDKTRVEIEKTGIWSMAKGIHSIIEDVAKKHSEKQAVSFNGESVTYGELNDRADKIAQIIFKQTLGGNEIVGLCLPRSIDMIVGLFAILKAGCAYLPLDAEYPEERLKFMLVDTAAKLVVTNEKLSSLFEKIPITKVLMNALDNESQEDDIQLPEVQNGHRAYVIYTSGSTGKPKGVPITHANIINSTWGRTDFYDENPTSFLLLSSIAFDSSKAGVFWTLCTGGKLVISEERLEQDIDRLGKVIATNKVSHTLMLPTLYKVILEHLKPSVLECLRTVIVAGEACSSQMTKIHFEMLPQVKLYNEYGPTEATVWCIAHQITGGNIMENIPIGKPVAGAKIYLLDIGMNRVPFGAVGEIYVGGPGLADEYLNRQELTAQAFINNPFSNTNEKLYKTGDLAKIDLEGNMLFVGRADHQVKIRGHRIELDEIKNVVLTEQKITDVEVVVNKVGDTEQLVLYMLSKLEIDIPSVKRTLTEKLPKYMVPSRYLVIPEFPKLPNGKVDKKALALLKPAERPIADSTTQSKVLSSTQQKLVTIWKEVLKIGTLSVHDNFFEIGGDSILSIQIITQARKLGLDFSPNELFEHQTIAELEVSLLKTKKNLTEETTTFSGSAPLNPIQHWFFETHKSVPNFWNQAYALRVSDNYNRESVKRAAEFVFQQHDALRTLFTKGESGWSAEVVGPASLSPFEFYDISNVEESVWNEKIEYTLANIQVDIALDKGPLFRCIYFDAGSPDYSRIILLAHHLVVDMVSWKLILEDFISFLKNGTPIKISRTTSMLKWGNYLADLAKSTKILEELDFWKEQAMVSTSLPTDFQKPLPIAEKNIGALVYTLDLDNTRALTTKANESYSTKTDELVMTALARTFTNWSDRNTISFAMERHGRETLGTDLDLSNTVGWFTAFFPLAFEISGDLDLGKDIGAVKEKMRNIPHGGIGYGILRYLTNRLGTIDYPQLVFNFLGHRDTSEFEFLTSGVRHHESERNYVIEINSFIENGALQLYWSYSKEHYLPETMEVLLEKFDSVLKEIIIHCTETGEGKFTPSDFPELGLDQDDLDGLLDSLDL